MHVLHVIDALGLGGAERMLVDLANATVRDGHRVSVCVTRQDTTLAPALDPRIEVIVLDRRRRWSVAGPARLTRFVRRARVDVVHAHMRSTAALVLLLRALRLVRVPIVFHDHFGGIETDRRVPAWFRIAHREVDHYVGVSDDLRRWAHDAGMPEARTSMIANALDLARFAASTPVDLRVELGIAADVRVAVHVATLRRDKGIETMLEAVAHSRHRDRLVVAVAGARADLAYVAECETLRARLGLDATVRFLGGRTDVPGLLRCADVALSSSHTESGPLVLIEYLVARVPFVATRVGDIGRRLDGLGVPGFVPPGDPKAFAAALDALLDVDALARAERAERAAARGLAAYDLAAVMPRWYEVYRAVGVR